MNNRVLFYTKRRFFQGLVVHTTKAGMTKFTLYVVHYSLSINFTP